MMAISTGIPESWKLPLFWAVVDGSKAGNLSEAHRALIVGQMFTSGGNAGLQPVSVPTPVGSLALAGQYFGIGSMIYRQIKKFLEVNTTQQLWAVGVAEPSAGTAATGSITISTAATASGVLTVYIGGQKVSINVGSTDVVGTIATNLAAAINLLPEISVTAVAASAAVNLTCKWKGLTGNDITIIPNYLGLYGGEILPTGVTLTIVAMASGAGVPDCTAAVSAIQSTEFDYVSMPFSDTATAGVWSTEFGFGATGRWNYTRQQYGIILSAKRDTYANLLTWGLTQNDPVTSTLAIELDSPQPVWEWSAAYCGIAALGFSDDPARPLQTLEMPGILPARIQNRFTQSQLNSLSQSGLAVQSTAPDGNPMMLIEQTQYQLNSFGQSDTAFGLLTVLTTLQELLRRMKSAITSKYPRVKLVPDGTRLGPGQAAVTPTDIKAELISEFGQAEYDGLVSDLADFKANLVVEIDDQNPNRVNVLWPPQLAGQLRQLNALAQFRLLYPPVAVN
jgi:phage tail sheath gpL-like